MTRSIARGGRLLLAAAATTAVLAALSVQEYLARHWGGGPISFDSMLLAQALGVAIWAALAATVIRATARRFPFRREDLSRTALIHLGGGLAIALVHTIAVSVLFASYYFPFSALAIWDVFRDRMHTGYSASVLIYLVIATAISTLRPGTGPEASPAIEESRTERYARRILVKNDGRTTVLPVEQVDWIEAADNNVIIHAGAAAHPLRGPLGQLASRLDPARFARVHRSTLLNLERVREVQPLFHGELVVILRDGTKVTVGRTYRDAFLGALEG